MDSLRNIAITPADEDQSAKYDCRTVLQQRVGQICPRLECSAVPRMGESLSGYHLKFPWASYRTDTNEKLLVVCPGRLIILSVLTWWPSDLEWWTQWQHVQRYLARRGGSRLKKPRLSRPWSYGKSRIRGTIAAVTTSGRLAKFPVPSLRTKHRQ
jgi:hypothetical protein